ncbi:MAG: hypothetical protein ACXWL2_05105 [Candidatus Chromulinivorax sp.]
MKLVASRLHNIAWFKLADFVTRGEKERALHSYRLLMHSITDKAFALQLEADILLAFHDPFAVDKYCAAAQMYQQQGDLQKAIAVYEYVLLLKEDITVLQALLDVYEQISDSKGLIKIFTKFAIVAVQTKSFALLINRLHFYLMSHDVLLKAELCAATFFALLLHDQLNPQMHMYLEQALHWFEEIQDSYALHRFMAKLQVYDLNWYAKAEKMLYVL